MADAPVQNRNHRLLIVAITVVGTITGVLALVALVIGWGSADAAPWQTGATIGAALCAVIGVLFAIVPGGRR